MKKESIVQLLIVIIGIFSITINFLLFKDWRGIFYYTILSNIYVTLFYAWTLFLKLKKKLVKNEKYYILKGLMLVAILCTMLVFFAVVNNKDSVYVNHSFECTMVHIVMPVLALIECAFFEDKKVLKYKYVPFWGSTSILYLGFLVFYRKILNGTFLNGREYPYDIINFEKYGITKCLISCLLVFIIFLILGVLVVFFDNKMKIKKFGD
jgi:hypothetical protein